MIHMHMETKRKMIHGFTLVETLIAISILTLSVLAAFTSVQGGLQSSNIARDQTVAYFLTQEAMEYIKNIRDENALASLGGTPVSWLRGLSEIATDPCYFGKICTIDSPAKTASNSTCGASFGSCQFLRKQAGTGLYGYGSGWPDSIFRREIKLEQIVAGQEIRVTISVQWLTGNKTQSFQISQSLFNRS